MALVLGIYPPVGSIGVLEFRVPGYYANNECNPSPMVKIFPPVCKGITLAFLPCIWLKKNYLLRASPP